MQRHLLPYRTRCVPGGQRWVVVWFCPGVPCSGGHGCAVPVPGCPVPGCPGQFSHCLQCAGLVLAAPYPVHSGGGPCGVACGAPGFGHSTNLPLIQVSQVCSAAKLGVVKASVIKPASIARRFISFAPRGRWLGVAIAYSDSVDPSHTDHAFCAQVANPYPGLSQARTATLYCRRQMAFRLIACPAYDERLPACVRQPPCGAAACAVALLMQRRTDVGRAHLCTALCPCRFDIGNAARVRR
jgi:hypothetical protein